MKIQWYTLFARYGVWVVVSLLVFQFAGCVDGEDESSPRIWAAKKDKTSKKTPPTASRENEVSILPICSGDWKNEKEFLKGVTKGKRVAQKAWSRYSDCHLVDPFTDTLIENIDDIELKNEHSHKTPKRCNYMGQIEGVFTVLAVVEQECEAICLAGGELVGALAAKAYCDLMIASGGDVEVDDWVRGPINFCGMMFESECDFTFIEETTYYENPTGLCEAYTYGDYGDEWEMWSGKACDYQDEI